MDGPIGFIERHFASSQLESILGLLAAVLPTEYNVSHVAQYSSYGAMQYSSYGAMQYSSYGV